MRSPLSLLDWFGLADDSEKPSGDAAWPIDLTGEVRRGWPINPADARTLFGALGRLGFINNAGNTPPRDEDVFAAFQIVRRHGRRAVKDVWISMSAMAMAPTPLEDTVVVCGNAWLPMVTETTEGGGIGQGNCIIGDESRRRV